jgi:hypothetical protein
MHMPAHPMIDGETVNAVPRLNLLYGVDNMAVLWGAWAITFAAGILTLVGLWTRVSAIVLAVGVISLHMRGGVILNGGDTVMRVSLLYLAISPCGAACSLDRILAVWRGEANVEPEKVSLWMQRILCWNTAVVYFTTLWIKSWGSHWRDMNATWYTARLEEFYRFPVPHFLTEGVWVKVETFGTLAVEFALATFVFWRPARKWVLLSGILMHAYIQYSMNIPLFAYLMTSWYIAFYDGEEVTAWAKRVGQRLARFKVTVTVPPHANKRALRVIAAMNCFDLIEFEKGEKWSASRADGSEIDLHKALISRLPGSWVWFWAFRKRLNQDLESSSVAA